MVWLWWFNPKVDDDELHMPSINKRNIKLLSLHIIISLKELLKPGIEGCFINDWHVTGHASIPPIIQKIWFTTIWWTFYFNKGHFWVFIKLSHPHAYKLVIEAFIILARHINLSKWAIWILELIERNALTIKSLIYLISSFPYYLT